MHLAWLLAHSFQRIHISSLAMMMLHQPHLQRLSLAANASLQPGRLAPWNPIVTAAAAPAAAAAPYARAAYIHHHRERAVRAKVAAEQQQAAAAAAAAVQDADLDELYADSPPKQQQQQGPPTARSPTQAAAAAAGDDDPDLDDLYALSDRRQQQQRPAAHVSSRASPRQAVVAAAAAAHTDGTPSEQQQQQQTPPAASRSEPADSPVSQPPAPAAATAVAAATGNAQAAPAPAAAAAAAAAASGGGRAPPTRVEAPELPSDLGVFRNAVLLVDKPKEWTSFDACNAIKKAIQRMGVSKVGHAGTLDPAATGLLIICTGAGTKSIEGFMAAHKEYSGTLKLGEGTPSLDAETEVEKRLPWEDVTDEQLLEAAKKLTGDIEQVPPMYSALHHNGKRLHELARAGETVDRPARPVNITRFDVHRDAEDRQLVHFYVGCSKGTYIRTLGHDLATSLGTTGHLVALRREAIGDARVDRAWQMTDLQDKLWAAIRACNPDAVAGASDEDQSRGGGRRPRGGGNWGGKGRRRGRGGGRGGQEQQPDRSSSRSRPPQQNEFGGPVPDIGALQHP